MAVLSYLPKLKGDLGLAFKAHFLHDFSIEMFLFNTPSTGKVSVLLSFYLVDDVTNHKIYVGSNSKAMADTEKKRGRRKYKNLNISRTKRAF